MPTYKYRCTNEDCDHEFVELRMIADRKVPEQHPCPECEKMTIQQCIGAPPIAYDGAGRWKHNNDFNDHLKEMRKKLPEGKLPIDDTIR